MKTFHLLCICFTLSHSLTAQNWDWANKVTGNANSRGYTICRDNNNSIFVSGSCDAFVSAGNAHLNAGNFLIKYDATGSVLWGKNVGFIAQKMCTDWVGNLYAIVSYSGTISSATNTFTSAGGFDFLLVKFDILGNESWARSYGGKNNDTYSDMISDPSGNLFITGWCDHPNDTLQFSTITFADTSAYGRFFLSKTDPSGTTLWVKSGMQSSDSSFYDGGRWLAIDNFQNVLVLGYGLDSNYWPGGYYFWGHFDQNGNLLSNQWLSNSYSYYIYCFDRDENGNLYTISDGGNHPGLGTLECYDPNWNLLWSFFLGFQYECYSLGDVHTDKDGNAYIYGSDVDTVYTSCIDSLNRALVLNHRVPFAGIWDVIAVKVNNTGNLDWIETAGGPGVDLPSDMCVTRDGDCYLTGAYNMHNQYQPFITGIANFGNHSLSSDGQVEQCFTAKIGYHTTVNVKEMALNTNNLLIYPNPAQGEVFIRTDQASYLKITDMLGRCVFNGYMEAGTHFIDLSREPKGVYIAELRNNTLLKKNKIVND